MQHVKYENIFAFGDCTDVPTTRGLYATLNQGVALRNNLWDYLHGNEFKGIYEGYSSYVVNHSLDRLWIFKHYYGYVPTAWNFYVPRFLGWPAYKLKNSLEHNYFKKLYSNKPNYTYPYLNKDKYYRPLNENKFLADNKIGLDKIFIHPNHKPTLSFEGEGHGHGAHHGVSQTASS